MEEDVAALRRDLAAIAGRMAVLEAREAIRQTLVRYGIAADGGDDAQWAKCWSQDACYERGGAIIAMSRGEIAAAFSDPEGAHKCHIEGRGSIHAVGPLDIELVEDTAMVRGASVVLVRSGEDYAVYSLSHNLWHMRRSDSGWEISRRISRAVGPGAAQAVYAGKDAAA